MAILRGTYRIRDNMSKKSIKTMQRIRDRHRKPKWYDDMTWSERFKTCVAMGLMILMLLSFCGVVTGAVMWGIGLLKVAISI